MYFALLMGTFVFGTATMLGIMGVRQWNMGYRIAGGISLIITLATVLGGITGAYLYLT